MQLLYQGFDGLDVAFAGQLPGDLAKAMELAKREAADKHRPEVFAWKGIRLAVDESGGKGGYAYRCDTGPDGAVWFFKRPKMTDAWGVRVSVKSLALALHGIHGVRQQLHDFLEALGTVKMAAEPVSLGRVDYAVDLQLPGFELRPDAFVMHSRCTRADNREAAVECHGLSGRYTGVRVGKMPGRQVAVYDKRADVIAKRKVYWWEIWNARLAKVGQPAMDWRERETSQVWRFELRAGKSHLKERWRITTWEDFDTKVGDMLRQAARDVRYVVPVRDRNRTRWPEHPAWRAVAEALEADLFEMQSDASPQRIKEVVAAQQREMLRAQVIGCMASYAACGAPQQIEDAAEAAKWSAATFREWLQSDPEGYAEKIADVRSRRIYL